MNNNRFTIITFYQFKKILNLESKKKFLKDFCFFHKIRGTVLLANEGINGSMAALTEPIKLLEKILKIFVSWKKLEKKQKKKSCF